MHFGAAEEKIIDLKFFGAALLVFGGLFILVGAAFDVVEQFAEVVSTQSAFESNLGRDHPDRIDDHFIGHYGARLNAYGHRTNLDGGRRFEAFWISNGKILEFATA